MLMPILILYRILKKYKGVRFVKVTKYTTNDSGVMRAEPVFTAGSECGAAQHIIIDKTPSNVCKGFGVALTGASCYELARMEPAARKKLLTDIYGKDGLNLSVARLAIGSCDYSAEIYTYDDVPGDIELKHFSIERDRAYILPMIKEILEIRPDLKIFASPWSPPGWMKTGGFICGGYMRTKYIDVFADYIIKYLEAYEKEGIHISALTPQNEPDVDQYGKFPACIWNPDQEAKYIFTLSDKLKAKGMDVDIWFHDHNFNGWRRVNWMLEEYPKLTECCSSAAFHYYNGCIEMIDRIKEEHPEIRFQFTEGGPRLKDCFADDWCKWGTMMAKALNHGCETFTGWNLMLDEEGRPNVGHCYCAGLVTLNSVTEELSYSGQYRAFNHFAHFIQNGAEIYRSRVANDGWEVFDFRNMQFETTSCAAKNPDGSLVVQVINPNSEKRQCQIFYDNSWWYFDVMENSVSTVVFRD